MLDNRNMLRENPSISSDQVTLPTGVTQVEIDAAREELYSFARDTLKYLIREEAMANGCKGSLELYCRMDIGIHWSPDGELCYFVNELCRNPLATALWTGSSPDTSHIAGNLGAEFAPVLHRWVSSMVQVTR